ncbi:endonuclease MutS2 [Nitrospira moscoviensis]|uniref:Endonuclease MutS2 n=1 Tax=Nitrospira moscoviensis TaxID=42253 RepID=A0A0K2GA17_NITMO|nr:endonuclease MutS2 [Nitrospira moscoviensis]ALA57417.1 MutS2 protein [Nitrospira moscoviensis]
MEAQAHKGDALSDKAAQALEWPRLLEALAQHARSAIGAARCRALPLADDLAAARARQQETTDMAGLLESGEVFPAGAFPDIREHVTRAAKGGTLEAHELRDSALVMAAMDELRRYMAVRKLQAPALAEIAEPLHAMTGLQTLKLAIEAAIQPDGSIKESATPELRRLTQQAQDLKQEMRQRLEHMLHSRRYEDVLQEFYFAEREGRYVLPVKADMRGRLPGIVHDVSASGATVFLEPRELVDLNNSIKVADREVEREVRRILRELSGRLAAKSGELLMGLEVLAEIDCVHAKALLSRQLRAGPVALNDRGRILLKQARHPLLVLTKPDVVPNDILMDERTSVLIISGPNTGGKTVTLKIVGLCALMVRAGLHVPCAPESEMGLFTELYADIGDAQDLSRDLSSFSAHMVQLVRLLSESAARKPAAESTSPQSLVLLDEPVTSTDPREGAALAEALLCRLASLNMKVVATTHYGPLKELAQTTPGFANASVEFDVSRLAPTYRLFLGIPGGSSALDIAARLGMEEEILSDARARLRQDDHRLDDVMADLQAMQRRLADDAEQARQAKVQAEQAAREVEALRAQLEDIEREARKGIKKKLGEQFQRARAEVQATVDALKHDQKLVKAKETKQRLAELEQATRAQLAPPQETIPVDRLTAGSSVEIAGLGMTGVLLEPPQGKKRVRVRVGEGEVVATVANLIGLAHAAEEARSPSTQGPTGIRRGSTSVETEEQTVIDVRGQAADEALDQVVAALDRAALSGAPLLRIIHGHGTGRLKQVLREYLRESPYVQEFRPGDRGEGGDGVTIVRLR